MDFREVYRENQNFFNLGNKGFRPHEPKISTSTYLPNSSTYFSRPPSRVKEVCNRAVTYQFYYKLPYPEFHIWTLTR
jgi:hypothetical protein